MLLCTGCIVKINKTSKHIFIPVNVCYSSSNYCLTLTDCFQFTDLHGSKFYESGISVMDANVLLVFFLDSSSSMSSVSFKFDVFNSLSLFSDVNCMQCLGNLNVLILILILFYSSSCDNSISRAVKLKI